MSDQPIFIESPVQGEAVRVNQQTENTLQPAFSVAEEVAIPHRNVSDVPDMSEAPPEVAAPRNRRALSLDALRGLFLVSMTLGFTISSQGLPHWMYHMQFPGGEGFVAVAGLTWRDLAYASFLFTMSAALPLTLSRRMDKGERDIGILLAILRRGFMLLVFALLIGHSNTYFTGYTQEFRAMALGGFLVMAMIFTRRRPDWNPAVFRVVNAIGWIAAIALLTVSPMLYGKGMDIHRIDDIIVGLAFAAMMGSIIWYLTRDNLPIRVAVLAIAIAAYLGAKGNGWVADWWWAERIPLFTLSKLTLLTVVIPGTIAGDLLLRWMRQSSDETGPMLYWSNSRIFGLAFVCMIMTPIVVFGLYNRWVAETTEIILGLMVGGVVLTWGPRTPVETIVRKLFLWASLWLLIGLVLEPFEDGIRKVPDTLSYFFTVTGLASMLLVSFFSVIDLLRRRRLVRPLIDVGHNPLLTYVLYTVFLNSLMEMIPAMRSVLRDSPAQSVIRSVIVTVVVVLIVQFTSRKKIFWRT